MKGQVGGDWREVCFTAAIGSRDGLNEYGEDQEAGLRLRRPYGYGDVVSALLFTMNEHPAVGRDASGENGKEEDYQSKTSQVSHPSMVTQDAQR